MSVGVSKVAGATAEDIRRLLNQSSLTAPARYMHRTDKRLNRIAAPIGTNVPKMFPRGQRRDERASTAQKQKSPNGNRSGEPASAGLYRASLDCPPKSLRGRGFSRSSLSAFSDTQCAKSLRDFSHFPRARFHALPAREVPTGHTLRARKIFPKNFGAVGRTRTVTPCGIRPSNVRVYQFHHDRTHNKRLRLDSAAWRVLLRFQCVEARP